MADETKRVIDQTTDQSLSAGDFIIVDSQSEGTRKFDLGTELTDIKQDLQNAGMSDDVKQALLQLANKVAYIDDDGLNYYQSLYNALYPLELSYISCVYTQSNVVGSGDSINELKTDLVVTAHWSDDTTTTLASTAYTLSGTLTEGTSTITVTYNGKTTTFNVMVSYTAISYIASTGTQYINTGVTMAYTDETAITLRDDVTENVDMVYFGVKDSSNHRVQLGAIKTSSSDLYSARWTGNAAPETARVTGEICKLTYTNYDSTHKTLSVYDADGTLLRSNNTGIGSSANMPNYNTFVFGRNDGAGNAEYIHSFRLYEFVIKNSDGNERLHLVPALVSDVPCVFDKVSETFLYNAGSGTFNYA